MSREKKTALQTQAEASAFVRTGRYAEVERLCADFERAYPGVVRTFAFGTTPEGRPLLALVATRTGALTADALHARRIPVLLVQGGIHPGESDGKDAGFIALRELLAGSAARGSLGRCAILFVPVFNVDGHERFGRWNRPNQNGPREMGWRANAQNLNLNRDCVKADAPETQAMLALLLEWDPLAFLDLHTANGAQFEHDVSITVEPIHQCDPGLHASARKVRAQILASLERTGSLPLPFYPSLLRPDDPAAGFADAVYSPRYATGYHGWRNRLSVLVETHSWRDYETRVRVTRNVVVEMTRLTAAQGPAWQRIASRADANARRLGGKRVGLAYAAAEPGRTFAFSGYRYVREPSPVSGTLMTRYDTRKPQVWNIPLRDKMVPTLTVDVPKGGYVIASGYAGLVRDRLAWHGIEFREVRRARRAAVDVLRAESVSFAAAPFEGRTLTTVRGEWRRETRQISPGAVFVPVRQPRAWMALALLEPQAPDSFVSWGFFNAAFEQKEYMEGYVLEEVAATMLARDPALASEFAQRVDSDVEFARDPAARLEFFHRRHPSWDERFNLCPVFRVGAGFAP